VKTFLRWKPYLSDIDRLLYAGNNLEKARDVFATPLSIAGGSD